MAYFAVSQVPSAQQLDYLSRAPEGVGAMLLGTNGQVTAGAGMAPNVGTIPINGFAASYGDSNGIQHGPSAAIAGATVTIAAADPTNPRRDVVVLVPANATTFGTGTIAVRQGTPAAVPLAPDLTLSPLDLPLAEIYVGAAVASIVAGNITDRRQQLRIPHILRKTNTQTVNNSSVMVNDNIFLFPVAASELWICRLQLLLTTNTAAGFKYDFTVPAAATYMSWMKVAAVGTAQYTDAGSGTVVVPTGTTYGSVTLEIVTLFTIGATAGTVQFRWAQQVANATDTTLHSGVHATVTRAIL